MHSVIETVLAEPMAPFPCEVLATHAEPSDTFTIDLATPGDGFSFTPGQFTMLYVFGVGEVPISISGDPAGRHTVTHTIRRVGAVTRALGDLKAGDHVGVRGPFGTSWPIDAARGGDVVIVAGGIGLAPLRPALYAVLADRAAYQRVFMLYGSRTPNDLLYAAELQAWRSRFDLDVYVTVDRADPGWYGSVGVVTRLIERAEFDPASTTALVCGPEIMMRYAAETLTAEEVAEDRIFLSMERNMKCAVGFCGHCQYGPNFVCRDGPVLSYAALAPLLSVREL